MKKALITGISGQDGSYLAELLLEKGYEVHGIIRHISFEDTGYRLSNIAHIQDKIFLHGASLENQLSLYKVVKEVQPDECYHLAARSFVSYGLDESSILTTNFNGTHHLLEAICEIVPSCRVYFAGSSEMFGYAGTSPQNEFTPFYPRSMYGISKLAGYHLVNIYRKRYGIFICTGILYNHESPRRGFEFVTRKITSTAAKIKMGFKIKLILGNLEARRDWGYAPDYVRAMWMMLQQDTPDDYIVATGRTNSVKDFVDITFKMLNLNYKDYVVTDQRFYRSGEEVPLCGDSQKIRSRLGWKTTKLLTEIIEEMVQEDLKAEGLRCDYGSRIIRS
ncbi:NAD-dependent epimerase/dehydratase [Desulfofarcimen acetoxidans DSM 771]|jgi:GDPmannose 4,6-dehydratase|uniref:GDP-mannose 4,6-dehydratase n=1 Tax=Desulfofarcimen acetoxidans (strain ATCC 49208 / DSM 771 / KCTC 5769 / VKM B-1644 / 5575) TaxID=485916 RepID=C8W1Y3_DESAS|nr:GDP-mannose 4,6-dehydratase [Desulfofarcimen acetoxidans]ACV63604.1 NAD-dependent epimerase/dehydratase [Desulfofarcimen acetoxidans DSM 771]